MKKIFIENVKIKSLLIVSILIFFLPFLQTCSNENIKKFPSYASKPVDPLNYKKNYFEKKESLLKELKNNCTKNGYELAFIGLEDLIKSIREEKDFDSYPFISFITIIFFSILNLLFSIQKKWKLIFIITTINLILLFGTTYFLYFIDIIEEFQQIKYGYYLFVINSFFILIKSKNNYDLKLIINN